MVGWDTCGRWGHTFCNHYTKNATLGPFSGVLISLAPKKVMPKKKEKKPNPQPPKEPPKEPPKQPKKPQQVQKGGDEGKEVPRPYKLEVIRGAAKKFYRPEESSDSEGESESESHSSEIDSELENMTYPEEETVPSTNSNARYPPPLTPNYQADWENPPPLPDKLEQFNIDWIFQNRDPLRRDEIEPEKFIVLYGKRGTGKTWAMRNILYHAIPYCPQGFVVTNTPYNGYWQKYFPAKAVWKEFDPDKLRAFIDLRKKYVQDWVAREERGEYVENPYAVLILEDCISSTNLRHAEALWYLAANGRHLKMLVMISTQYPKGVGPIMRTNADYICVFFQATLYDKETILENYFSTWLGLYPRKQLVNWLDTRTQFDESTMQRQVIVLDNMRQTAEVSAKTFTYNFVDPGPFKFGSLEFWQRLS